MMGRICEIQRFSLHDGPGIRTTLFLKGCPLSCAWCHNPESQSPGIETLFDERRCIRCGNCETECPTGARRKAGRDVDAQELLEIALQDRIFFDESGGGVTLSGGEPLLQAAFAGEVLRKLRSVGVHTAIETCGFAPVEDLLATAALADLVLFDLKLMDGGRHRAATGVPNGIILANVKALAESGSAIWIRVPVIPGINDDGENLEATAELVASLPGVERVDLLPFHGAAAGKYRHLGRPWALERLAPPSPAHMEMHALPFRSRGLAVTLGGQ